MSYEINRTIDEGYISSYEYVARNDRNQIMRFYVYWTTDKVFLVTFYITTKRKDGYQYKKETGKDGIKPLIWAKDCLIDFLKYAKKQYHHKQLRIYSDDKQRQRIYAHYLIPLGFTEVKNKDKYLYINL